LLLEIGSGSGAFLSLANKKFRKVVGIELDLNAQRFLKNKNLNVFETLSDLENSKFDVIVMFHVLEHLLDPVSFLKELKNYLNEGGKIVIEVPNVDDSLVKLYNIEEFKNFYFCSAHVSYFSSVTLKNCVTKAGLKGDITQVQRYDLNNHVHWFKYKKPGTLSIDERIYSQTTLKSYEDDLILHGMGDTLWGVFYNN